ncbi:MAG TPA: hypothetical protein VFS88_07605 [Micavibrio sp.]|nr:hypothetical protein [Micavibrio sp.]
MSNYVPQKKRHEESYIDEQLMADKTGRKVFKSSAYSMGIAVGFLILSPLLPDMGETAEQSEAMVSVFRSLALWMIAYSIIVAVSFLFLRSKIKMILMMLNWFLMPGVVLWGVFEIKDILTGGGV